VQASVPGASNKLGKIVTEWVSMRFFSMAQLSDGGRERNELWHKGSLGDEDDGATLNTCIAQRKRTITHSTMKNRRKVTCVLVTVLCNQPKACASDLGDDQSRYL